MLPGRERQPVQLSRRQETLFRHANGGQVRTFGRVHGNDIVSHRRCEHLSQHPDRLMHRRRRRACVHQISYQRPDHLTADISDGNVTKTCQRHCESDFVTGTGRPLQVVLGVEPRARQVTERDPTIRRCHVQAAALVDFDLFGERLGVTFRLEASLIGLR